MTEFWISLVLVGALAGWLVRHIATTRRRRGVLALVAAIPVLIYLGTVVSTTPGPDGWIWFMIGLGMAACVTLVWFAAMQIGYWIAPSLPHGNGNNRWS